MLRECCGLSAKFTGCPSRDGALGVIGGSGKASLNVNDQDFCLWVLLPKCRMLVVLRVEIKNTAAVDCTY